MLQRYGSIKRAFEASNNGTFDGNVGTVYCPEGHVILGEHEGFEVQLAHSVVWRLPRFIELVAFVLIAAICGCMAVLPSLDIPWVYYTPMAAPFIVATFILDKTLVEEWFDFPIRDAISLGFLFPALYLLSVGILSTICKTGTEIIAVSFFYCFTITSASDPITPANVMFI
jgi:hypothetical protein